MIVCGLVISLKNQEAYSQIERELGDEIVLGEVVRGRLPAVVELEQSHQLDACWNRLLELDGVAQVDLAYADYGEVSEKVEA